MGKPYKLYKLNCFKTINITFRSKILKHENVVADDSVSDSNTFRELVQLQAALVLIELY